jgi:pimeloyl-ACP methyl ester carboxylesterase
MNWHGFFMYGMGAGMTDPGQANFCARIKKEIPQINLHASPYTDEQVAEIAALIDKLPPEDGVFGGGTSLGSNNAAVLANYTKRRIDGLFGFQASLYGAGGPLSGSLNQYPLNDNVKFAHLISSSNPIPAPGLGAFVWPRGTMNAASYHRTQHDIPHPGDYDLNDQMMFINEMKRIIASAAANAAGQA